MLLSAQFAMLAQLADAWRNPLLSSSMHASQAAGATLITATWQGVVVAGCLGISLRTSGRISAGLRFTLWAAGFLVVLGLPFLPLLWQADPSLGIAASAATHAWLQIDERWSIAIALLWAAASIYRAADLLSHAVRLRKLWKEASPVPIDIQTAPSLWGRRIVEICTCQDLDRPSVIGFFAPRILIPDWLFSQMTPEELKQIVLHETEHLRRGDDWTNLLQKLSLVLFPLNPALLWMDQRLCLEREMACDEAVIRVTRAPKAYAACLTNLAARGLERRLEALSLGAWQRRPELVQRVQRILARRKALGPLGTRGLATVVASGLLFGTVELARCPQLVSFTQSNPAPVAAITMPSATRDVAESGDAVFPDHLGATPVSSTATGKAHMVELRATMPIRRGVAFISSSAVRSAQMKSKAAHRILPTQPAVQTKAVTEPPAAQILKADLGDVKPTPMPESGYLVLTTWEEIEPATGTVESAANAGTAATAQGAQTANAATENGAPGKPQTPGRIAVTQFVIRVVPASFRTTSPAIVPLRDGWLVIQL